jgi:apolipoprotein N-acyltransferase
VPSFLLALIAGALLALSFPRFGTPAMAWIALVPLLVALAERPLRASRGFFLGVAGGLTYYAGTLYWISGVMAQYGGFGEPLAVAIAGLLVVFLSLFSGLFGAVMALVVSRLGRRALIVAPAVWVATELGRTWFGGGFPWTLVGYSQAPVLPVAQAASLVGVYGLSALVVSVNAALAHAVLERRRSRWRGVAIAAVAVAGIAAWGQARLSDGRLLRTGTALTVGMVQGNVPQDLKWEPSLGDDILEKYLRMSREAIGRGARLVVWPESATPFYFEEHVNGERIRKLARDEKAWLLVGSDEFERGTPPRSYNAAFLVAPDGRTTGVYRKVHLVPFGEYVPLRAVLFFAAPLVQNVSDFAPGSRVVTLPFEGGRRLSTAICYEVVYPALIREGVLLGSDLLTTITNDAWFGRSSAPWQHFDMAAMRAIEQGRYLVRSANTGISGIVDPYGRVLQRSALFEDRVLVGEVRLIAERTWYARLGDVVAWASVAVTVLALAVALAARAPS